MVSDKARPAEVPARVPVCRTDDPADLARAFAARLAGTAGARRALAAWALARDTLEGTMAVRKVEEGACRPGCAWCCRLPVEIRLAEAAHLARRASADPALEARLRATAAGLAGLTPAERLRAGTPCAFLDPETRACSVYEDRPLSCRSFRSRDADWCRALVDAYTGAAPAARRRPEGVVREALGIRGMVQQAMVAVTPPEWRAMGELHALTLRVLDRVGRSGGGGAAPDG